MARTRADVAERPAGYIVVSVGWRAAGPRQNSPRRGVENRRDGLRELLLRYAAARAMGNTDNHGRNTSVLKPLDGGVVLSPVYDSAPMFSDRSAHQAHSDQVLGVARRAAGLEGCLPAARAHPAWTPPPTSHLWLRIRRTDIADDIRVALGDHDSFESYGLGSQRRSTTGVFDLHR